MASNSQHEQSVFYKTIRHFPPVTTENLNTEQFLAAVSDLIVVVDRLGKLFMPVKYDMQGNVAKIKKQYEIDASSCLFQLMSNEINKGQLTAAEGVLWLNRALLFFELIFQEMILALQENKMETSMETVYTVAYEGSVKKYHNWMTQQVFHLICKMSPTFQEVLKSFDCKVIEDFKDFLQRFQQNLHLVRTAIDNFFKKRNLFCES